MGDIPMWHKREPVAPLACALLFPRNSQLALLFRMMPLEPTARQALLERQVMPSRMLLMLESGLLTLCHVMSPLELRNKMVAPSPTARQMLLEGQVMATGYRWCRKPGESVWSWERWTDGNLSARQLLECTCADPGSHEVLFRRLLDTTREVGIRGNDSSVRAARSTASVCSQAYVGVPAAPAIA